MKRIAIIHKDIDTISSQKTLNSNQVEVVNILFMKFLLKKLSGLKNDKGFPNLESEESAAQRRR